MNRLAAPADCPPELARGAEDEAASAAAPGARFWTVFTALHTLLPDEVFERLPKNGASEHDHYLYGAPIAGGVRGIVAPREGT